jgi:DNA-binding response OmpR family regulator
MLRITAIPEREGVTAMKLLYAEDEKSLSEAVVDVLEYNKFSVDAVYDGRDAPDYAQSGHYDGIILDVMMPKLSGLEVLERLRAAGSKTPILLLTAKSEIEDRIAGLDLGADDYLPKPFAMGELLARIRAMLRRRAEFTPDVLTLGNLSLDRQSYTLSVGENRMILPKLEFQLMELFLLNRGIYLSTEDILVKVWGYDTDTEIGVVWVYISYLRKKLTALGANVAIQAKRNIGYTLTEVP